MKHGNVEITREGDGYRLLLLDDLTPADLRWLCFMAGPALLVQHDPLPKAYVPPKPTHGL